MKKLFKFKKIFMLSTAIILPIGGIAIAVPLLIKQYPTSNVLKMDELIQTKVLSNNQLATVTKKVKEEKTVQEFNKITEDKNGNKKVTWKEATIPMVSKELTRVFPPTIYEKPSKVEVHVIVKPKEPIIKNTNKHTPTTLVEKIFAYLTNNNGEEKTKDGINKIREQHFKELEAAKKV